MALTVLQLTSLMLRVAVSIIIFYFSILFFSKVKQAKGTGVELSSFFGLGIFALFIGIMYILFTYYDYFIFEFDLKPIELYKSAILTGYFGIIGLVFLSEKMFKKTKYAFTSYSIICCIYGIFFLSTVDDLRMFTYFTLPISIIIVLFNFFYFSVVKTKGEIRKKMSMAFIGKFGFFFFYLLSTEVGKRLLPFPVEFTLTLSHIGLLFTLIGWGLIFLSFETFTEFGWKEKMKELFIIGPNGGTLFHYSFLDVTNNQIPDLISAGLAGIKDLLAEMIQSKQKLKVVDHQDIKIIFEYGNYSTIALVAFENLHIYQSKLASLTKQFEDLFQDVLINWRGETEVFLPSRRLIEEIFGKIGE